jgi:hypothetical protein
MSDLKRNALEDTVRAAHEELIKLLGKDMGDLSYDLDRGVVTVDGVNFTYQNGLCMTGFCLQCNQEVPSKPIKRLADINSLVKDFRPGRHLCMDI